MKRTIMEDWTLLPFLASTSAGFIVAVVDFVFLQSLRFQLSGLIGVFLSVIGGFLRYKARLELKKKAGYKSLLSTAKLQIVEDHRLVTDGLYRHIRHPIYLGETLRNLGFVVVPTSLYGMLLIAVATIFLLFRIEIEEKMLIDKFGEKYKEYQRNTKKIMPYIY